MVAKGADGAFCDACQVLCLDLDAGFMDVFNP